MLRGSPVPQASKPSSFCAPVPGEDTDTEARALGRREEARPTAAGKVAATSVLWSLARARGKPVRPWGSHSPVA